MDPIITGCDYIIWNGYEMVKCRNFTAEYIEVSRRQCGIRWPYLCEEHRSFVVDSMKPTHIQTSKGLMHIKTIKEKFKDDTI